ncbi:DUF262 domain-containing protein [Winogradskyella sp. UBA3174]|uniref:DUF262 domain-containing protein n=1 Tax=Winogradskyella sp. UBA3174 TaxID=1947785 RepID=UPI0025D79E29|nr:DUF262 domain-containing protein [Winogradskyella sp. UBA3174]|tara:strand:- start:145935 stop:147323 length:1389 start_codon:yes stop_codon:yes gene_type:complete
MTKNKAKIISINEIFHDNKNLNIPDYQRPYKWNEVNVQQLIEDIILHQNIEEYRLGTIVLHEYKDANNNEVLDIVDGQQRLITLSLISLAIEMQFKTETFYGRFLKIKSCLLQQEFPNLISQYNLQKNFKLIQRQIRNFNEEVIQFFYENCKVVWVEIEDVSEAFQFFDSQNSRGKDLEPHDLLKAFHLREMEHNTEKEVLSCVSHWEQMDQEQLSVLFNDYLFRVRNWSKGRSARFFNKSDVHIFKGISLEDPGHYNFIKPYRINHFYTEKYNSDLDRKIDGQRASYPFQIDQIIINGKRFFEFVTYYSKIVNQINDTHSNDDSLNKQSPLQKIKNGKSRASDILEVLSSYSGKNRTGDRYVRNLFDCCLLYYLDKFGNYKLDQAIEKFFIWTYTKRLDKYSVQLATIDNRGMESDGFFRIIREAIDSKDIFQKPLETVIPVQKSKTGELLQLFKDLNYLN